MSAHGNAAAAAAATEATCALDTVVTRRCRAHLCVPRGGRAIGRVGAQAQCRRRLHCRPEISALAAAPEHSNSLTMSLTRVTVNNPTISQNPGHAETGKLSGRYTKKPCVAEHLPDPTATNLDVLDPFGILGIWRLETSSDKITVVDSSLDFCGDVTCDPRCQGPR